MDRWSFVSSVPQNAERDAPVAYANVTRAADELRTVTLPGDGRDYEFISKPIRETRNQTVIFG